MFRGELHPRDRVGRFAEKGRVARVRRIEGMLPRLERPVLRGPTPAQADTELTLAKTFGFTRPLGKDANGNYLVAAGGQRHSIDPAGRVVQSARVAGMPSPGATLAVAPPIRRGTVDFNAYRPRRDARPSEINYIDPPTIPEGMTMDEYRRRRAQKGKGSPGYYREEVGSPGVIEPPPDKPGDYVAMERIRKGVYEERARAATIGAIMAALPELSGDIRVIGERVPASPGVVSKPDWKNTTEPIPAFGSEGQLGRISDEGLRNLLSLRGLPAPRKAQVRAEVERRRSGGGREADLLRKYGFKVKASPGIGALSAREVERMLTAGGFQRQRQRGSHAIYRKPEGGRNVVVPRHGGSLPRGTLHSVLSSAGLL